MPNGVLPTNGDVLRDLKWQKTKSCKRFVTEVDSVSCPGHIVPSHTAGCSLPGGCQQKAEEDWCTLQKVKARWLRAGYEIVAD